MQGVPIDQYEQSQQCALGALNLEYLMGNVQKPGAMLQSFKPCPARDQIPNTPRFLHKDKMLKRLGVQEHKGLLDWDMAFIPAVFKAMKDGDPYQIHAWFERSGNKHVVLGNATCLDEIVPNLDFVCHIFMYPTAFSVLCADMLLPSAEWLETNLVIPQLNAIVIRQAVTHLFETVEEGLIWTQIVQKMAEMGNVHAQEAFTAEGTNGIPMYRNEYEKQKLHLNNLKMSWEEAAEKGVFEWCTEEEYRTYYGYKAVDEATGKEKGFGTPSKKCEVYCESNTILGRTGFPWSQCFEEKNLVLEPASKDYEPLCYYKEPAESPLTDTEYPLVLTEGRLPMYHHGTLRNNPYIREIYPAPEVWISPEYAEEHGIATGDWVNVKRPRNTYMVWDAAQNEAIAEYHGIPAGFEDQVVSAATIAELEAALGIPAGKLEQTVTDFNKMANDGYDPAFFRAAETMRAFGEGPFYAIEMIQAFLNTQGGARRNARAEVVGTDGEPIPHLYSAGEFGGMTPYQYNGGGNMAECLIFGQLAGVGRGGREGSAAGAPHGRGLRDRLYPGQRQPRGRSRSGRFRKARRERVSRHLHPVHGQRACREGEDGGRQDRRHRHRAAAGDRRCGQLGSRGPAGPDHRGPVHRGRRRCRRYRFLHGPEGRREQRTRPGEVARLMR